MGAPLAILAALAAALALAGPGGGEAAPAGGAPLDPDVAVRVSVADPAHGILAPFSFVVVSLERTCPPPAILACRPAIRFAGRLRDEPPPDLRLAGRVTSRGEVLAHWRVTEGVLEVVTGGLPFQGAGAIDDARPGIEANPETLLERAQGLGE